MQGASGSSTASEAAVEQEARREDHNRTGRAGCRTKRGQVIEQVAAAQQVRAVQAAVEQKASSEDHHMAGRAGCRTTMNAQFAAAQRMSTVQAAGTLPPCLLYSCCCCMLDQTHCSQHTQLCIQACCYTCPCNCCCCCCHSHCGVSTSSCSSRGIVGSLGLAPSGTLSTGSVVTG
jgi:hypothetical protein